MSRLLATLALMLALAAPASAAPVRLGTSITQPVVDSTAGRVVWQPDAGSIRLLDLGAGSPARPYALPGGCQPSPRGLRGDRLLLDCSGGNVLLDLRSGAGGPVPGWEAARAGGWESWVVAIGRFWGEGALLARICCDATVYFELSGSRTDRTEGAANELPDLDSPQLWRRMCSPLTRTRATAVEEQHTFLPYSYSPPLGLDYRAFPYRPLRVDRCGRERPLRLSRCPDACVEVNVGAGSIAWREPGRIRLYRGASRRAREWRARRFGPLAEPFPTSDRLVVVTGRFGAYSVWSARAPT